MRILFCNYEYPPLGGGGGVINALLAEELAKRHHVTVLTSAGPNLKKTENVNGVRIVRVPIFGRKELAAASFSSMAWFMLNGPGSGAQLLTREKFDIINTHFALPSGPVGNSLSKQFHIPNVLSVHGGDLYDPSKFTSPHRHFILRKWVTHLLHKADAVVGQSRNTNDNVTTYYDSSMQPELIPLGIKRPSFPALSRTDLGLEEDDAVLVTVGRLVSRKANDRLLHLFSRIPHPKCKLVIIGSGPQLEPLQTLARQLNISDKVMFAGFVSEEKKLALLKNADIYVSTSQHEGFGLVFLEAMAAGLPVACYNHGGQTDFLEHDRTGALLNLNDEDGMLSAINRLLEQPEQRSITGQYNLNKVERYFIENCAQQYEALFNRILSNQGKMGAATAR